MNEINEKDEILNTADYLFRPIKVKHLLYASCLFLFLIIATAGCIHFPVTVSMNAQIFNVGHYLPDSCNYEHYNVELRQKRVLEIPMTNSLATIINTNQITDIIIYNNGFPVYKDKGQIIQYVFKEETKNKAKQTKTALVAQKVSNGKITFFPPDIPYNSEVSVVISPLKINLSNILNLLSNKNLKLNFRSL